MGKSSRCGTSLSTEELHGLTFASAFSYRRLTRNLAHDLGQLALS